MISFFFRSSIIPGLIVLGLCAVFLFAVKYKVQTLNRELSNLNSKMISEKESIHVLKAEWAYLTRPKRIKRLAEKHLGLKTPKSSQIKTMVLKGDKA